MIASSRAEGLWLNLHRKIFCCIVIPRWDGRFSSRFLVVMLVAPCPGNCGLTYLALWWESSSQGPQHSTYPMEFVHNRTRIQCSE